MEESDVQQFIQIDGVQYGCQLLRNNSGALKDAKGRWVRFGLGNISKKHSDKIKSSDLFGVTSITVTQDMVGKTLAVATAVEVKEPGWKRNVSDPHENAQEAFLQWIRQLGGFAGFANSVESFRKIIGF